MGKSIHVTMLRKDAGVAPGFGALRTIGMQRIDLVEGIAPPKQIRSGVLKDRRG